MNEQAKNWGLFTLFALVLLLSSRGHGQTSSEFGLFEPVEASNNISGAGPSARNARSPLNRNASIEPVFSLVGTSRIGIKLTVALRHMGGDRIRMTLNGPRTPIPGYERYAVVEFDDRQVGIQYPLSAPCNESLELGVSCDSENNIAVLRLTAADATMTEIRDQNDRPVPAENSTDSPRNPFEALRNAPENHNSGSQANPPARFQPQKIDPADVPPGMRVVSTPFGDRLVEI